jgi:putative NADH-flavin reductase
MTSHSILVLGATGPTGRHIVTQALDQGYTVTALARRLERLDARHPRLTTVAADVVADAEAVARTLPGHDVVISALGRGQALRSQGLMARAIPGIVTAMERLAVRRLVFLSAYGVGGTAPHAPWVSRLMIRLMLADIFADKATAEEVVQHSVLDWTILAPVMLTNGPATGRYRLGDQLEIRGLARIARADVASAVLTCIDDSSSIHKRCIVAS